MSARRSRSAKIGAERRRAPKLLAAVAKVRRAAKRLDGQRYKISEEQARSLCLLVKKSIPREDFDSVKIVAGTHTDLPNSRKREDGYWMVEVDPDSGYVLVFVYEDYKF